MDNLNTEISENADNTELPPTVEDTEISDITEETNEAEEKGSEEVPEKKNSFPTQAVLTIRTIVGAYVVYLAYQILTSGNELSALMWAAVGLFIVAGSGLVIMSIKHFICGEYEGGKKDV